MVPRYARPRMTAIWEPENKYRIWFEIEAHALDAMARLGTVPSEAAAKVRQWWETGPSIDVARIDEIEGVVKHDVIAFLTWVAEQIGPEARFLHQGMTSSDVLDTCLAVQLKQAGEILLEDLDELLGVLERRAREHKLTPTIGRSHGIHAEPVTFGLKLAFAFAEFRRQRARLVAAVDDIATCAISGAVGTFANVDPRVEAHVAERLVLAVEPISTQVIPRDRHAHFFAVLGGIAASIERVATEIRHLQRTEVLEAEEFFSPGQKGSSAMPHKRNPVLSENLTGLARMVRAYVAPALENVALWHERDISHSSAERFVFERALGVAAYATRTLADILDGLEVDADRMRANLDQLGGMVYSEALLLAMIAKGADRQDAYRLVQAAAKRAWAGECSFGEALLTDPAVGAWLAPDEIERAMDLEHHLSGIGVTYRALGLEELG
jgi:adenylosuccinate lyase